jgi:hypothetical protein
MSLSLLTFDNNIIEIILKNIDKESLLILGLVCKELYETLKEFNPDEKLIASLKYLTSNLNLLNLLKYAHKNGCPWDEKTCDNSSQFGQLECLKYAHENDCPWTEQTCELAALAALGGHIECLKYAHENGCPWSKDKCLKYLHENTCLWSKETCYNAAKRGHLECLQYAREICSPE